MATQSFVNEMQTVHVSGTAQQAQHQPAQTTIIATQPVSAHSIQPTSHTIQSNQQFLQLATEVMDTPSSGTTVTLQTTPSGVQQTRQPTVYQGQLQYVQGPDHRHTNSIYANGAMTNPYPYSEAATMYQATPVNYFGQGGVSSANLQTLGSQNTVTGVMGGTLVGGSVIGGSVLGGSQLIAQPGRTYLVQGHSIDGDGHPITHTTRASPATAQQVQWLLDNYETAEGVSLPRSTLYNHYLRHCQEHKLDPVNAASFGKLIRSVFLGLRTRRLGTRGNSKYHYYGIRIKSTSSLNQFQDDSGHTAMRQQPINSAKRFKPSPMGGKPEDGSPNAGGAGGNSGDHVPSQTQQHQQFLGDSTQVLPEFKELIVETDLLPEGLDSEDVEVFQSLYREHCESILDVVVNLQFPLIEQLWQTFWRCPPPDVPLDEEQEKQLDKDKLFALCKLVPIQTYIKHYDHILYQGLVEVLIPDVLRPIPSALTQAIRNFAKSLESWLRNSMSNCPAEMLSLKVGAVTAFAQTLRRYTSLNHLAQAARAVLQNTSQINQMLSDLNRVDFANVQEQASWVCQCDDAVVQQLEQDFKRTLQQQNSLEQWAAWLKGVVTQILEPHEGSPYFAKAARQFLLKWSFYSSMVIRDLTLRSAASFGSFHLIRLLYDEYMFYLIEHKVASATGETPIAVMDKVDSRGERISMSADSITENGDGIDIKKSPSSTPTTATVNSSITLATGSNGSTK
ncbi:transcription factor RFX3 isoform X3 [Strongylocentrotus purpuratus]|uniref:RFX-type winged-helix domain-containing protein n=1 Tax=Strongylocentrotus purpuratus TaxID=7668 RepID=A0A7M7HH45_STRPU|nr:transcription factor RFX3 isoform X3 [Strongylocentrotus purpuratus]